MLEDKPRELETKLQQQHEEFHKQLKEKDEKIKALEEQIDSISDKVHMEIGIPPYKLTVTNYQEVKASEKDNISIQSSPMYTHPGGYKITLEIFPKGWMDNPSFLGSRNHHSCRGK